MKEIKTDYLNKMVDDKFYEKIKVENVSNIKYLTEDEFKDGKQGYVLAPYIMGEHTEESLKEYNEFMDEYHKQHECCPKCGATEHALTYVGYVLNWDKKDEYKDMNRCECMKCGDKHSAHDRIKSINIV
jgi:hypothetical protein